MFTPFHTTESSARLCGELVLYLWAFVTALWLEVTMAFSDSGTFGVAESGAGGFPNLGASQAVPSERLPISCRFRPPFVDFARAVIRA